MNISEIGWTQTTPGQETNRPQLDQQDFLRLLITQISHQDPLNPADSSEFLAQLAQFSGLEQMIQMNTRLDALTLSNSATTSTSVAALIGKTVTAAGDQVELTGDEGVGVAFDLPACASEVELTLYDESGRLVRTVTLGDRSAGAGAVRWDGCDDDGNHLPPGRYRFALSGIGADGEEVVATGRVRGVVTGVSYDQGVPTLLVGDRRIALGDVIEIS